MQKNSQEQGMVVRGQVEEMKNGQMGYKRFGDDDGVRVQY